MIELDVPTVVLVGAPNVGKSSLVRAVSSGTPEVNDYPFTTRGVTVGHIVDQERGLRFQVMDTPG
jgi:nucleolar GTP-binding protein